MQQWYQCPNCGAQVAFGVRFCDNCGTPLNWPTQQQTQLPSSYQQQQKQWNYGYGQQRPKQKKTNGWLVVFFAFIAIVVLAGGAAFGLRAVSQQTQSTVLPGTETSPPGEGTPAADSAPPAWLPAGKAAFVGKLMWGDMPVAGGTVVADTQAPVIVYSPEPRKEFSAETDDDGNYRLIVDPDEYYLLHCLPGSDYLTYDSYGFVFSPSYELSAGEVIDKDLQTLDWSIELTAPGEADFDTAKTISENPPRWCGKNTIGTNMGNR